MNCKQFPSVLSPFLLFAFTSCNETLPTYKMPHDVLKSRIEAEYVLSPTDNSVKVYFVVVNTFDETLEGPGVLRGTISLTSARDPRIRRTYEVGPATLISARGYDRLTGMLRIDPGDSIRFLVSWNFINSDNGVDLRTGFFRYYGDLTCNGAAISRCFAYTEPFVIEANIKIYDQTAPQIASISYPLCFVSRWVLPKLCPSVTIGVCEPGTTQTISTCTPNGFEPIL